MPKNLVIVESPAKAKTINKFLGKGFRVESCYGHIKDLPQKNLGIDIENRFKPTYRIIPGKGKVVKKLRDLSSQMEKVYLATDLDREGEAISWHLSQEIACPDKARIVFNQVTREAIREAMENPGQVDLNKVSAQQGRRVLDRLVGYKLSPLLWEKVKRGLSAGRVQSVAVRLVCEREKEIGKFIPEEYWVVAARFGLARKRAFLKAKLCLIDGQKVRIGSEAQVREIAEKIKEQQYQIVRVRKEEKKKSPPPPFTTSTLQQAAAYHLRFSSARTMKLAQDLYEGQEIGPEGRVGLITYPRTDSVRVAKEVQKEAREWVKKRLGDKFLPSKIPYYRNRKSSQDAHEAVRPTRIKRDPEHVKKYLSDPHYKLYELIWKRFVGSQMEKATIETVEVEIQGGVYLFKAESRKIKFPGYLLIYKEKERKDESLPAVKENEKLKLEELTSKQQFTKAPARYTEASLVKTLEEKGIGRPSTYAPIISTIKQRGYVKSSKGGLIPTSLARVVNDLLVDSFSSVLDPHFTARMEEGLDAVEQGKRPWTALVGDFYDHFKKELDVAEQKMKDVKREGWKTSPLKCEKCGGEMVLKFGRYGEFLACSNYPRCKNTKEVAQKTGVSCPSPGCEGEIIERLSKKGRIFYGCSRFPQCRFVLKTEPVAENCPHCENPYLIKVKNDLKCPECGKRMEEFCIEEFKLGRVPFKIMKRRWKQK
ncbi:MAG: type I DNA topoisomerase [bacterium]